MTTNKPEVFEVYRTSKGTLDNMVLLADYEALLTEYEKLRKDVAALVEALEWYSEHVLGCRKTTSEGEQYRTALDRDGGARARAALAAYQKQGGEL